MQTEVDSHVCISYFKLQHLFFLRQQRAPLYSSAWHRQNLLNELMPELPLPLFPEDTRFLVFEERHVFWGTYLCVDATSSVLLEVKQKRNIHVDGPRADDNPSWPCPEQDFTPS